MHRALPEGDAFSMLVRGWNPAFSSVIVKRTVFLKVGGFDPGLPAFTDHDLLLRIAQTGSWFAAVADAVMIQHDYGGPQISTTPRRLLEAFERMDRKWAPVLRNRVGAAGYRRWRAQLFTKAQHARVREAVARGHVLAAWQGLRDHGAIRALGGAVRRQLIRPRRSRRPRICGAPSLDGWRDSAGAFRRLSAATDISTCCASSGGR
jgi:hypothetical protein